MILLNETEVALCYLKPVNCTAFSKLTNATIKSTPTQRNEIAVSVHGVRSSGYWKVRYINEVDVKNDICKFIFFARAKDLQCQSISRDEIHIYCFSRRMYPSGSCNLYYTENMENYVSEEGRQLYSQDTSTNNTYFLTTTCTFVKPAAIATTDTFTAVVTMFPNISGSLADVMYGTNVSVLVTFSKPFIKFENCPKEVDFGATVDCQCSVEGIEPVNAMFRWYNTVTNVLITNTSRLTLVATEHTRGLD
ncbi:polymorphic transmembrane cluster 2 transmembrane protein 2 [Biomphalaria glabrata]|nr:polymorphic transmembrane cluster 2 transmembrane protein 2 [Biomphalaria glabrata]